MMVIRRGASVSLLLCSLACAQRTFVVDAANGPGTNFTDLPPALAQAQHGDVYLIRPGTYSPSATDKGVTLLGGTGVTISGGFTAAALAVSGLAAGRTFTAKGLALAGQGATALDLSGCAGHVHLDSLQCTSFYSSAPRALVITQCSLVTLSGSTINGGSNCSGSTLVVSRSTIAGIGSVAPIGSAMPGFSLGLSRLLLTDSVVRGGDGYTGMGANSSGGPAISAFGSQVQVFATGAATARLDGGRCNGLLCTSAHFPSAVVLNASAIVYSPFVTLTGNVPLLALLSASTAAILPLPAVVATGGMRGGTIATTLVSTANDPFALLLGLPAAPQMLASGLLCVETAGSVVLALGPQSPTGITNVVIPVPLDPALRGLTIVQQGAALVGQLLLLTNPEQTTIE